MRFHALESLKQHRHQQWNHLPDGIVYRSVKLENLDNIEPFINKLYKNKKFLAWNIDRRILREELSRSTFPVGFDALLKIILNEYFKKKHPKIYIYKCGEYIWHIDTLRSIFPDAKFIFILRDIRAVYNSQKTSFGSRDGKPMANYPILSAVLFNRLPSIFAKYCSFEWFYVLKYEDLVSDKECEMNKLLSFLGSSSQKTQDDYYNRIPEEQRHLHPNICYPPQGNRAYAWQNELSKVELMTIQNISGDTLTGYGYQLVETGRMSFKEGITYLQYWTKYLGRLIRKMTVKILRFTLPEAWYLWIERTLSVYL